MEHKFRLGALLQDKITLFEGIATSRIEYINGCIQYSVKPNTLDKDGKPQDAQWFDQGQLIKTGEGITVDNSPKQIPGGEHMEHPHGLNF